MQRQLTCCCPLLLVLSPVFKGDVADAAPPKVLPEVDVVVAVLVLPSGGRNPVGEIGTTSKNCFYFEKSKQH